MPVEVVWSRLAREELLELYLNIGMVHQAAAERLYDRVEQRLVVGPFEIWPA